MATDLTFTQDGSKYVCTLTPTAPCVIQIERGTDGDRKPFTVYAYEHIAGKPTTLVVG